MITNLLFDFSRVILFPKDGSYKELSNEQLFEDLKKFKFMRSIELIKDIGYRTIKKVSGFTFYRSERSILKDVNIASETQDIEGWMEHNITPERIIKVASFVAAGWLAYRFVDKFLKRKN